ncbi:MAG: aminotransferase class V-fold PLP-dependent enzyme, partial [Pseudomonadota bacterium]
CFMQAVRLPIGGWADREGAIALRRRLRNDFGIEAHIFVDNQQYWVRISAYIYNDMADYQKLGKAITAIAS